MMFFCPWGSEACRRKDSAALAEALHTLAEYDAVGVLERMADSKALLEVSLGFGDEAGVLPHSSLRLESLLTV